jgi:hypothetical protein
MMMMPTTVMMDHVVKLTTGASPTLPKSDGYGMGLSGVRTSMIPMVTDVRKTDGFQHDRQTVPGLASAACSAFTGARARWSPRRNRTHAPALPSSRRRYTARQCAGAG